MVFINGIGKLQLALCSFFFCLYLCPEFDSPRSKFKLKQSSLNICLLPRISSSDPYALNTHLPEEFFVTQMTLYYKVSVLSMCVLTMKSCWIAFFVITSDGLTN